MIIWSVEEGKLVKYERTGECNQCGKCCYGIKFKWDVKSDKGQEEEEVEQPNWSDHDGWRMIYAQGMWFYFKITSYTQDPEERCCELGEDNKCKIWKDPIKFKPICRYWPFHPDDVAAFPGCTFKFERIESDD